MSFNPRAVVHFLSRKPFILASDAEAGTPGLSQPLPSPQHRFPGFKGKARSWPCLAVPALCAALSPLCGQKQAGSGGHAPAPSSRPGDIPVAARHQPHPGSLGEVTTRSPWCCRGSGLWRLPGAPHRAHGGTRDLAAPHPRCPCPERPNCASNKASDSRG